MNDVLWTTAASAVRRTALPLASYYVVTLALPLANGAAKSAGFVQHALVVVVVPVIAIALACALGALLREAAGIARCWVGTRASVSGSGAGRSDQQPVEAPLELVEIDRLDEVRLESARNRAHAASATRD